MGGQTTYKGRVEVCEGGCWGPVCVRDDGWSTLDAQLYFDPQGDYSLLDNVYTNKLLFSHPFSGAACITRSQQYLPMLASHCRGNEYSLFSCAQPVCHVEVTS